MAGNGNYNAVSSSATTVTFARVALTVTADAKSKEYGVSDPLFTRTITSGSLVGSDTLSGSLTRESGEDVNTYAINQGTLANSNYDITFVPANLTITQRPITVTEGTNRLVGGIDLFTVIHRILRAAGESKVTPALWDGQAAQRATAHIFSSDHS
jgi:hypothetical protein